MPRYEINGHIVEFDREPSESDIDEAASHFGSQKVQRPTMQDIGGYVKEHPFKAAFTPISKYATGKSLGERTDFLNKRGDELVRQSSQASQNNLDYQASQSTGTRQEVGGAITQGNVTFQTPKTPSMGDFYMNQRGAATKQAMVNLVDVTPADIVTLGAAKYIPRIPIGSTTVGRIAGKVGVGKGFGQGVKELQAMESKLGNLGTSGGRAINTSSRGATQGLTAPEKTMATLFMKAVEITPARMKKKGALQAYQSDAVNAVKGIKANGMRPNSIETMAQALDDSMKKTYSIYDEMAQKTDAQGSRIPVGQLAQQVLSSIKGNKNFYNLHPNIVNEFEGYVARLQNSQLSATETEGLLKELNQALMPYYAKKDFAAVNLYADFAAKVRQQLENTIEDTLGQSGYQNERNQYKAYKTVQSDLLKAVAKKELARGDNELGNKALNTFAAEELMRGILFANPASLKMAAGARGLAAIRAALRNPDRKIAKAFKIADKMPQASKGQYYGNQAVNTLSKHADSKPEYTGNKLPMVVPGRQTKPNFAQANTKSKGEILRSPDWRKVQSKEIIEKKSSLKSDFSDTTDALVQGFRIRNAPDKIKSLEQKIERMKNRAKEYEDGGNDNEAAKWYSQVSLHKEALRAAQNELRPAEKEMMLKYYKKKVPHKVNRFWQGDF